MSATRTDGISRFFAPKSDISNRLENENHRNNINSKCKRNHVINKHAEWETPIGLTPEAAIEIPDCVGGDNDDDDYEIQDRPLVAPSGSFSGSSSSNGQIVTESSPHGHVNPFQEFAHQIGGCETSYFSSLSTATNTIDCTKSCVKKIPLVTNMNISDKAVIKCSDGSNNAIHTTTTLKRKRKQKDTKQPKRLRKTNKKKKSDNNLPFSQMTSADQDRCKLKWQSFTDENDPLEIRRFQVFIAARIHCQAHENTVRAAMLSLRNHFSSSASTAATTTWSAIEASATVINEDGSGGQESQQPIDPSRSQRQCAPTSPSSSMLCPETLSKADPSAISQIISSVLFANVKSKQIIRAANEINVRFRGIVPETKHGLQQLTGIGPKLGELLHHVNSIKAYDS